MRKRRYAAGSRGRPSSLHPAEKTTRSALPLKGDDPTNPYFTAADARAFTFYRIPKELITAPQFRGISTDAKLLYGLLLDRMSLSERNGWLDGLGRVYLYYTVASVREDLCCGKEKACKLFAELERADLIERRRQGQGKPARIYVKRFQRSDFPTSGSPLSEPQ